MGVVIASRFWSCGGGPQSPLGGSVLDVSIARLLVGVVARVVAVVIATDRRTA
jgi:hypothetical protein